MAAWGTPPTHVTGDTLAVSDWNTIANNETFLYQAPYASAYNTVGVSCASATWTQITLSTLDFSGYSFALTSNNLVAPIAGIYWVSGFVMWTVSTTIVGTGLYQNGTQKKVSQTAAVSTGTGSSAGVVMKCAASDTIGLWGVQDSGGNASNVAGSTNTYLSAFYVGST